MKALVRFSNTKHKMNAVATAIFMCFVFKDLIKGFIRGVLDELALVGNPFRLRDPNPRGMRGRGWQDPQQLGR